jgi:hypothetical protein|tara:strand:+ start:1587 stop:1739 length:153 start_codon:yes stop_codon:yes gene_type:complete
MISAAVREWISVWFFVLAMSVLLFFVAVIMPFLAIVKMVDELLNWRSWRL